MKVIRVIYDCFFIRHAITQFLTEKNYVRFGLNANDLINYIFENYVFDKIKDEYLPYWTTIDFCEIISYGGLVDGDEVEFIIEDIHEFIINQIAPRICQEINSFLPNIQQYTLMDIDKENNFLILSLMRE